MENILDASKTSPKSSPKNTIYNTPKQFNKIKMRCIIKKNNKPQIKVITSNKMNTTIKEKVNIKDENQIQIYKKNNDDFNRQTSISQNVQNIIDNNPIPFVKIKKKIKS